MSLPTLRTSQLLLRPFVLEDAVVVQRLAGAYEVASGTLTVPHPYEDGMAESWIGSHEDAWEAREGMVLAMVSEDDGVVGAISLDLNEMHRRGELGYWVGVPFWGQGYATEASSAVIDFGLEVLELNRIQAQHFVGNPASGRVMQKVGMEYEGTRRQHVLRLGRFEDLAVYSVLSSDRLVSG